MGAEEESDVMAASVTVKRSMGERPWKGRFVAQR
jgi:hypothetical protein